MQPIMEVKPAKGARKTAKPVKQFGIRHSQEEEDQEDQPQ
jgi:hypothetical protein